MDARALALALPRATTWSPSRYHAPPPHAQSSDAGRAVVARVSSLVPFSAARELARDRHAIGAYTETRGRALAAQNLGFHTGLALSFPVPANSGPSTSDALSSDLDFLMAARCFDAAPDTGVQGPLRRGFYVVCRAYPLGAASPAPFLHQPAFAPARSMLGAVPGPTVMSRKFARTGCTDVDNSKSVTDKNSVTNKEDMEVKFKWNLHIAVGAVGITVRLVIYLAKVLKVDEYITARVKFPGMLVAAATFLMVLGKSLYAVANQTKDISQFILYFLALYKEHTTIGSSSAAAAVGKGNASAAAPTSGNGNAPDATSTSTNGTEQ